MLELSLSVHDRILAIDQLPESEIGGCRVAGLHAAAAECEGCLFGEITRR